MGHGRRVNGGIAPKLSAVCFTGCCWLFDYRLIASMDVEKIEDSGLAIASCKVVFALDWLWASSLAITLGKFMACVSFARHVHFHIPVLSMKIEASVLLSRINMQDLVTWHCLLWWNDGYVVTSAFFIQVVSRPNPATLPIAPARSSTHCLNGSNRHAGDSVEEAVCNAMRERLASCKHLHELLPLPGYLLVQLPVSGIFVRTVG